MRKRFCMRVVFQFITVVEKNLKFDNQQFLRSTDRR